MFRLFVVAAPHRTDTTNAPLHKSALSALPSSSLPSNPVLVSLMAWQVWFMRLSSSSSSPPLFHFHLLFFFVVLHTHSLSVLTVMRMSYLVTVMPFLFPVLLVLLSTAFPVLIHSFLFFKKPRFFSTTRRTKTCMLTNFLLQSCPKSEHRTFQAQTRTISFWACKFILIC
jgi:hypothetical protein